MLSLCSKATKHTKGHSPPVASSACPRAPCPKQASLSDSKKQPMAFRLGEKKRCRLIVFERWGPGEQSTCVFKAWELGDGVSPCKILGSKGVFEKCLDRNDRVFQVSSSSHSCDREKHYLVQLLVKQVPLSASKQQQQKVVFL